MTELILLFRKNVPLGNLEEKCRGLGERALSTFKAQELSSEDGGTVFSENLPNYVVYCYRKTKYPSLKLRHLRNIRSPVILLRLIYGAPYHRTADCSGTAPWKYLTFRFPKLIYTYISKCIKLPKSEALCI